MSRPIASRADRRLRICLVIPKLAVGGAEMQVLDLIRHLDRSRFDVSLMALTSGLPEMERQAAQHLDALYAVGFRWRFLPAAFVKMLVWLRRGHFDVLHCHLPLADVLGRPVGWLAGIPVIVTTEHGKNTWKPWYYLAIERALNRITDMRICVSMDILEIRRRREGTPLNKLVRIPNAIDARRFARPRRSRDESLAEFGWQPGDFVIATVGRLEPEKNHAMLLHAMARLVREHPRTRCLIIGGGSLEGELGDLVASLALKGSVRLAGKRDDIPELLGAADLFVLSSTKEGLPVSLLEAMAAGRASVVTNVGGMPEVIRDGENGLVVPPGDADALAQAIGRLARESDTRLRMGDAAKAQALREFTLERVVGDIASLYVDIYTTKKLKAARP